MAWKKKHPNFMDLEEARRIGGRPITAKLPRWKRAFRILTRWAEEPCTRKEFDKRLKPLRNLFSCIQEVEELERQKELYYAQIHEEVVARHAAERAAEVKAKARRDKRNAKSGKRLAASRRKAAKGKRARR